MFAAQKQRSKLVVRTVGLANLTYNLLRPAWLERRAGLSVAGTRPGARGTRPPTFRLTLTLTLNSRRRRWRPHPGSDTRAVVVSRVVV